VELSVSVVVIDPLIEFPASVIVLLLVAESVSEYESPWSSIVVLGAAGIAFRVGPGQRFGSP
jgi:hypothetical protein